MMKEWLLLNVKLITIGLTSFLGHYLDKFFIVYSKELQQSYVVLFVNWLKLIQILIAPARVVINFLTIIRK